MRVLSVIAIITPIVFLNLSRNLALTLTYKLQSEASCTNEEWREYRRVVHGGYTRLPPCLCLKSNPVLTLRRP